MKRLILAAVFAMGLVAAAEAQVAAVTQADIKAIIERLNKLEAENKAQAKRIAELENQNKALAEKQARTEAAVAKAEPKGEGAAAADESTKVSESGKVFTTDKGYKYYLADATAGIFQPLSDNGLKITPYGWLTFEAIHNTHKTDVDVYTDWVRPRRNGGRNGDHQTVFSMNDSILGFEFEVPEEYEGWKFHGKFEFDLAGDHANDPDFHFRHLYFDMDNAKSGWNILFGQTWHLWKMVTPSEIDGAWLEQAGHPYRRSPQIRVTKRWEWDDSKLEVRAGLVKNGNGMGGDRDDDENQDNSASAWCLLEGAVVYQHKAFWEEGGRSWLVGLGGMYGRDKSHRIYYTGAYGQSDEYDTDMVMVAAQVPFLEKFTLTGQLFAGENLKGVQGGIGQGVGFRLYDMSRKGREVSTVGGFVDLKYELNDKWSFALGYGFDDPTDSEARDAAGRTYNARAYVDAFYRFNEQLHFGLEYARLQTKYYYEGDADDDRFQFTAYYDF